MASVEVRGCSAFASALVVVALFLPFVTVTSCSGQPTKTSTTGTQLITGEARQPAPTGARPYVATMALLAAAGLGSALLAARWAAVVRLVAAVVGLVVTGVTWLALSVQSLGAAALGPGWWLALFGFGLGVAVEISGRIAAR